MGGVEGHYNVACALRAFALIQRRQPDALLTVAGDGPQRAHLRQLARDLSLRNIRVVGRVQPEHMPALYDEHDVWLSGSEVDNMPMSILEAYACGLAVISTNPGGISYIVEDGRTGRLVKCGDAKSLTETALEVIGNPALFCGTDTKRAGRVRELHLGFGEAGLDHRVSQLAPKGTSLYPRQTCT